LTKQGFSATSFYDLRKYPSQWRDIIVFFLGEILDVPTESTASTADDQDTATNYLRRALRKRDMNSSNSL